MLSPPPAIPVVCPELGHEVPVAAIEHELHLLWQNDQARTNASLMNLVVYSEAAGSLLENAAIIRELTRDHACRAILVEIDRAQPTPDLRAWITAHCHLADGHKSVCCEQIAFYLTGVVTGRFRNTVFAHLNSDLPLVFWWQGELSDIFSERLVSVIDRLLVDSSAWADPAAAFQRIDDTASINPDLILQDHAWTRTWQFRLGVASIYDDPCAQVAWPELEAIDLTYHPAHRNSALQFLAWLAVQAGWHDPIQDKLAFRAASGRPIAVVLREDPSAPPLSALTLHAGNQIARVTQAAGASHVERRIDAPRYHVTSLAPIDPTSPGKLVALQLERGGKNSLFQKILPRFRKLLDCVS